METKGLTLVVVVLLLGGIVLLIFGFSMAPAVREAIGNVSNGEITDKPNIQKFGGHAPAATVGVGRVHLTWLADFHSLTT